MQKYPLAALILVGGAAVTAPVVPPNDPPFEPDDALDTFQLAEGFQIEVFAAEPLITDPVDMEVDEYGRIYVVEMPGYPLDVGGSGRVKLLSDADRDGRPDSATVFASGLTLPTGVIRWKDGVLVTDAPNVYYLEDTDGDGRADVKDVVLTGFALSNPQHNFNNPLYGLDNGIYLANNGPIGTTTFAELFGDSGSEVRYSEKYARTIRNGRKRSSGAATALGINASNRNVRFRPDRGELESLSSASQWGHAFDWRGAHFLVSNAAHQYHEVVAQRYLDRNPALPVRDAVASTPQHGDAAAVFPITLDPDHQLLTDRGVFTSASGLTLYGGGAFPSPFERVAFVAEPVHNLVHADLIEEDGATFRARRLLEGREFLASTDSWFRPVNFYVGPDGALYVIDYYREIVEHPEWMDEEAIRTRDLYRGSDRGRIFRIMPEGGQEPDWVGKLSLDDWSDRALVRVLDHENSWWRFAAHRLLVDRDERIDSGAVGALRRPASSAAGRVHALWTLDGLGELHPDDIRGALSDADPGVRENAIRLAEKHGADVFESELSGMIGDPHPRVRFQLLLTLGDVESSRAEESRLQLLLADLEDPWVHIAALTSGAQPTIQQLKTSLALMEVSERDGASEYIRSVAMLVGASGPAADVGETIDLVLDHPDRPAAAELSRAIADGYQTWRLETRAGDGFTGVVGTETASAVTIAMEGGAEITVPRSEIEAMVQLEGSSMPDGLENSITIEEMADLIAFLKGQH